MIIKISLFHLSVWLAGWLAGLLGVTNERTSHYGESSGRQLLLHVGRARVIANECTTVVNDERKTRNGSSSMVAAQQLHQQVALLLARAEHLLAHLADALQLGDAQEELAKLGRGRRVGGGGVLAQRLHHLLLRVAHLTGVAKAGSVCKRGKAHGVMSRHMHTKGRQHVSASRPRPPNLASPVVKRAAEKRFARPLRESWLSPLEPLPVPFLPPSRDLDVRSRASKGRGQHVALSLLLLTAYYYCALSDEGMLAQKMYCALRSKHARTEL